MKMYFCSWCSRKPALFVTLCKWSIHLCRSRGCLYRPNWRLL